MNNIEEARKTIIEYCKNNNYNIKKAAKLKACFNPENIFFSMSTGKATGAGLEEDGKTMPTLVFIYDRKRGSMEETKAAKELMV